LRFAGVASDDPFADDDDEDPAFGAFGAFVFGAIVGVASVDPCGLFAPVTLLLWLWLLLLLPTLPLALLKLLELLLL